MSINRFLRTVARCLCLVMLAGALCPRRLAWGAEAAAPAGAAASTGVIVLDASGDRVSLSAVKSAGITRGTEFRVLRQGQELARVRVTEVLPAISRARVVSGLPASDLRPNDRAEMIGTAPRERKGIKFPWAALVGAGVLALVVLGSVRDKGEGAAPASGGVADVKIN
ncbi:MAG: hypothetical protein GX774_18745 [Armatimonadetes bacterium]|nr:hypothetical protein [Armatimonadota bacterium]